MFVHLRILLIFILLIIHLTLIRAQSEPHSYAVDTIINSCIIVDEIQISGNKKTEAGIILRELTFKQGDTIEAGKLDKILTESTENILKTSLFHQAVITLEETDKKITFQVNVTERWYWWIWPLLENPDRNFNDWWQHQDITRLSAGVHFQHENMRGRMEKLNLRVLGGYRTYLAANYEWPYINRKKTLGLGILASYYTKYEVNYATVNNRQLFYHGNNIMLKSANYAIYTRFRPGNHVSHILTLQYADVIVNDTIRLLNPEFQLYSNKFDLL
ncbi:MAG: POTRA domain-containing protein, partial [Chloroflexota bacterium]